MKIRVTRIIVIEGEEEFVRDNLTRTFVGEGGINNCNKVDLGKYFIEEIERKEEEISNE